MSNKSRILRKVGFAVVGLVGAWVGFALLYDEPLDPGLTAFYAPAQEPVPDNMNAAIGLLGLEAPHGADIIEHGRFVADTVAGNSDFAASKRLIEAKGVLSFSKKPDELECLSWPEPDYPSAQCSTAERHVELLKENAELLQRYELISNLPQYQSSIFLGYNGVLVININKLIAEDVAFELHQGNVEIAYKKWRGNYLFLSRMAGSDDSWMGKAIQQVNEGISLGSIELLLYKAPELIDAHGDELMELLAPIGLSRWNLEGVMRAEYRLFELFEPTFSGNDSAFWVRPNFIANRFFRASQAALHAVKGPAAELDRNFLAIKQTHGDFDQWTWDYVLSPMNTVFVRTMLAGDLKGGELVRNMIAHDGRMRLLTLRILLARNQIDDAKVADFFANQPSRLRNPFTDQPMRWDETRRVTWFCQPERSFSCAQVRLPGGQWLDDSAKNCEQTPKDE